MSSPNPNPDATDLTAPDQAASEADLQLVERGAAEASQPVPSEREAERPRRGVPIWLFALLLIAAVAGGVWQHQIANQLEAEIVELETALDQTKALVTAHQGHLVEIRGGVQELSDRLQGLATLVDLDPTAGLPIPAERPSEPPKP